MSTKTTLKRIALVAVSALGFGVLATVPAKAAVSTYTASTALSTTSLTVVTSTTADTAVGKFYLDVSGNGAAADDGSTAAYQGLFANESIVITVTSAPSGASNGTTGAADANELTFQAIKLGSNDGDTAGDASGAGTFANAGNSGTSTLTTGFQIPNAGTLDGTTDDYVSNDWTPTTDDAGGRDRRYWFAVYANDAAVIDGGEYTVRVRTVTADSGFAIDKTLKIKFVSSIANAGATLTLAKSGDIYRTAGLSYVSGRNVTATLKDANGGRVLMGADHEQGLDAHVVDLNAAFVDVDAVVGSTLYEHDTGVAGEDHIAPTSAGSASSAAVNALFTANRATGDGVYGITSISSSGGTAGATAGTAADITQAAAADTVIRVRVTNSSVSSTVAVLIVAATTARDIYTDLTMSATGAMAYGTASGTLAAADLADVTRINVESSTTYVLPLTTTSGTLTVNLNSSAGSGTTSGTNVTGATVLVTPTWSNRFVSTAVTPATSTSGTSYVSDASGNVKINFTNTEPLDGATLTLSITGFSAGSGTVGTGSRTAVVTWQKPVITSATVLDPLSGTIVKTGATTTFTVAAYDQFDNALAGEKFQPSIGSTDANGSTTVTYATVTTGADGTATWSLTDAAADADDTDTVTFTSVTSSGVTAARTITYKAALPAVSSILLYYDYDMNGTASTLLGSSGLGAATALKIETERNQSRNLNSFSDNTSTGDEMVVFKAAATTSTGVNADGAVCTVAASSGGHILTAGGLPTSSRSFVVSSGAFSWNAIATTPGTKSFTVTCGSTTATAKMTVDNDTSDARFVTMAGAASGTAFGDGVPVTVSVTDRFGNGVSGVSLTLSASGVGAFTGGATTQSFTTDATGNYTFLATSLVEAGGKGTFSVTGSSTANQFASIAGYAGATIIDSTVAAGNKSASLDITFAAGRNAAAVAAEAATDAALEAIDAANAATDAANLAAEAADAATVAAEEARDAADAATAAVEALASEVATLMAALKAQITTLANTVAKIAKKVKA